MSDAGQPNAVSAARSVFLSYARVDQAVAAKLAAALQTAGCGVWWDAMIEGGDAFANTIEAALERCDAVVVLWSPASVVSDWVRDEAGTGRDRRKLVPVSIDKTEPPLGFRQYHAIDLSRWNGNATAEEIAAILRGIELAARREAQPERPPVTASESSRSATSRRTALLTLAGASIVGVAGWFAWRSRSAPSRDGATGNSIAVLPFQNLSNDPSQAYFSDGLTEEVRSTLARNSKLLVMAQTSAAAFREQNADAVTIAAKLNVAYLLGGSVRRSGNAVRIATDLIDGKNGFSRWSQAFERQLDDIFTIQSEIANAVSAALVTQVAGPQTPPADPDSASRSGSTTNIAAYDAYLRGRALYDLSVDEASERAALAQFDAAIAADPSYAAAHAARARTLTALANQYGEVDELAGLYAQAVEAALRAIALAPELADAHSTLGYIEFQCRLDARAARQPFERSRVLGAGEATVLARYAQYSARIGRAEPARESIRRALRLDPLNPLIHRAAGSIEYAAHEYAASIEPLRAALSLNPKMSRTHAAIGDALLMLGRGAEADAEYQLEPSQDLALTGRAIVAARRGELTQARDTMAALIAAQGEKVSYQLGQILAQLGETEAALDKLERAYRLGDAGLIYARNDPLLDPLRTQPRFVALLSRLGFE